ncbi:MAG TPA: hypothetical protein VIM79_24405 [Niastella sp.]
MKRTVFTLVIFFTLINVFAQHTEYRISLNPGLFSFKGRSSESVSSINYTERLHTGYTNNPYGSKNGLGYGISGNVKRVGKRNLVFGIDLGYERLRSKVTINRIDDNAGIAAVQYNASGKTFLNYDFLNFQPFVGYRFIFRSLQLDVTGGVDLAHCLKAKEKGNATAENGIAYKTTVNRETIKTDIRPRLQLAADYHRLGVYAGYSLGLVNYKTGYVGGVNESYARVFRFGVTYRLY